MAASLLPHARNLQTHVAACCCKQTSSSTDDLDAVGCTHLRCVSKSVHTVLKFKVHHAACTLCAGDKSVTQLQK